jgi:hypothetical protein
MEDGGKNPEYPSLYYFSMWIVMTRIMHSFCYDEKMVLLHKWLNLQRLHHKTELEQS